MNTSSRTAPRVRAAADEALASVGLLENPYFVALRDGSLSLEAFRRTQRQFFHAVQFFPRPMAAMVARIPSPRDRLDILHNLVEEHGEFREDAFHGTTFRRFLRSIGAAADDLEDLEPWACLRAFNSILTTACTLDELEVGVGCMGVIEHAFADVSALIGGAVVERGWVRAEDLVHYRLHAAIDRRHAEEFFVVVEDAWSDPRRRYFVRQGLDLGAYALDRLYADLHARAGRTGESG